MIEWELKGYWLTTYLKSMMDCWRIEKGKNEFWEKGKKWKRNRKAHQDRGIWELKSSQWLGVAKLLILQSWEVKLYEKCISKKGSDHSQWFFLKSTLLFLLNLIKLFTLFYNIVLKGRELGWSHCCWQQWASPGAPGIMRIWKRTVTMARC